MTRGLFAVTIGVAALMANCHAAVPVARLNAVECKVSMIEFVTSVRPTIVNMNDAGASTGLLPRNVAPADVPAGVPTSPVDNTAMMSADAVAPSRTLNVKPKLPIVT